MARNVVSVTSTIPSSLFLFWHCSRMVDVRVSRSTWWTRWMV